MAQVVAMRLPLEAVLPHLPAILEGVLLWAADSKNKFKLKVRRHADLPYTLALLHYSTMFPNTLTPSILTSGNHRVRFANHRQHPARPKH